MCGGTYIFLGTIEDVRDRLTCGVSQAQKETGNHKKTSAVFLSMFDQLSTRSVCEFKFLRCREIKTEGNSNHHTERRVCALCTTDQHSHACGSRIGVTVSAECRSFVFLVSATGHTKAITALLHSLLPWNFRQL